MNSLIRKSATPFGTLVIAVLFLIMAMIFSISGVTHAADNGSDRGRLITIHDRGNEKIIVSQAATVGDVLKEANITLDNKDAVEPSVSEKLVASNYQINIYRARPVIIIDGNVRQKVMTPYQTADQIATSAGVTLYPEDKTSIDRVDNLAEGAGLQLTITRATPINFILYGKPMAPRTQATTVGGMLKEKGIVVASSDTLSVSIDQPIVSGVTVELWRNGKQTISVDEDIPFSIRYTQAIDQQADYKLIKIPGVVGKKSTTYEVEMKNGVEVSRTVIQSIIVTQPLEQTEVIGTGDISAYKEDYMRQAGIADSDFGYIDFIVSHESGWCATKWQGEYGKCPIYHGAPDSSSIGYGLCQATPGYKMSSAGDDWAVNSITQLRWCNSYAMKRYGSWANAYNHWMNHGNW